MFMRIKKSFKRGYLFLFLFFLLCLSVTQSVAETLIPLHVAKGANLIQLTRKYCTSEYHWKELAKINGLKKPYTLYPGDIVNAPIELLRTEKVAATVASVIGGVFLLENGKQFKRVMKGDRIFPGQTLVTEHDGFTHLVFPDYKYTRIASDSKFTLTYLVRLVDDSLKADFFLERGRITHSVKKQLRANETFTTRTMVSITGVRGTEFRMKAADEDSSIVETLKGRVVLDSGGERARIDSGKGIKIFRGKKLLPPVDLPPVPEKPHYKKIYKLLPVVLSAPVYPSEARFRLRLTSDVAGESTVAEVLATCGQNFILPALDDGQYYGFLTSIDGEGLESLPARPFDFQLRTVPGVPIIEEPLKGKVTFDDKMHFEWLGISEAASYNVEIATDEDFRNIIKNDSVIAPHYELDGLETGLYYYRVQSVASDGFTSPYSMVDNWRIQALPELGNLKNGTGAELELHWRPMGSGVVYDLQIFKDKNLGNAVVTLEGIPVPQCVINQSLEPGTYYVCIRGILPDGHRSPWSPAMILKIPHSEVGFWDGVIVLGVLGLVLVL